MNASQVADHQMERYARLWACRFAIDRYRTGRRSQVFALLLMFIVSGTRAATLSVQVRDINGSPLQNAVVTATWAGDSAPSPDTKPAIMAQEHRAFVPHVLVVPRGSLVAFPNRDTTRHEVYSFSPAKVFEIDLYAGQPKNPILFDKSGVVVLGCNIHDTMQGFILVTEAPAWGKSDAQGHLTLSGLPSGQVTLSVWHPWLPAQAKWPTREVDTRRTDNLVISLDVNAPVTSAKPLSALQQRFNRLKP